MPGCAMAAARHNRPTIIVYGGTIAPGVREVGKNITSLSYLLTRYLTYAFHNRLPGSRFQ
jgi:dihydroxyacid dehydratase/phosphogluconate dehydratase